MTDQVFSLEKDQVFSMAKLEAGHKDWYIGLEWSPDTEGEDIDLDVILLASDANGQARAGKHATDFLYFNSHGRGNANMPYELSEDDKSGNGSKTSKYGDDEFIKLRGGKIEADVKKLSIYVAYFNGSSMASVKNVKLRVAPMHNGEPNFRKVANFMLAGFNSQIVHVVDLEHIENGNLNLKPINRDAGKTMDVIASYGIKVK